VSVKTFFVTLTYSEEFLPSDGSVSVREMQLYLKRLRRGMVPRRLRYFVVGEYGDVTQRPHYHLLVFGDFSGSHTPVVAQRKGKVCSCCFCSAWGKGFVDVQVPGTEAVAYVAGYCVKKMTHKDDERLGGRHPEFARMSLKPGGIGQKGVAIIAEALTSKGGSASVAAVGDVPGYIRFGGSKWPLGRYLLRLVRGEAGMVSESVPVGERFRDSGFVSAEDVRLRLRQLELMEPGARDVREAKRVQSARRAFSRWKIQQSKKGIGI